jgi:hypothetical protein
MVRHISKFNTAAWVLWSQHKEDEAIVSFDATLQQYPDLALFSMLPPFREQVRN